MEADGSEKIEKFGRGGIVRETEVYVIVGLQLSPLTGWVMRDDSVEILFQSFLQEAFESSSGMGKDVHSLTSIQHVLCRRQRRPPSKVP